MLPILSFYIFIENFKIQMENYDIKDEAIPNVEEKDIIFKSLN